jgi:hypothetical protein
MIQEHYKGYIRDDGGALLLDYVQQPKRAAIKTKTETTAGTFSGEVSNVFQSVGGPNGTRTRVPDVRGRCPNR